MRTLFWSNEMADPFKNIETDSPAIKVTLDSVSETKSSNTLPLKFILNESDFQALGSRGLK